MNRRINHKTIVAKKNRLSNLFYVRQAVASATFFMAKGANYCSENNPKGANNQQKSSIYRNFTFKKPPTVKNEGGLSYVYITSSV